MSQTRWARPLLGALLLLGLIGAPAAEATKPKRPKPCPTAKSREVSGPLENGTIVLFEKVRNDYHSLHGCHLRSRRRSLLASWYSTGVSIADDPPPTIWLAGRFVAQHSYFCPPTGAACSGGGIVVTDLRNRRGRRTGRIDGPVEGLQLTPRGTVAYVPYGEGPCEPPSVFYPGCTQTFTLFRFDANGSTVLDTGPGIDPESLASDGNGHVYWLNNGQPRVAPVR